MRPTKAAKNLLCGCWIKTRLIIFKSCSSPHVLLAWSFLVYDSSTSGFEIVWKHSVSLLCFNWLLSHRRHLVVVVSRVRTRPGDSRIIQWFSVCTPPQSPSNVRTRLINAPNPQRTHETRSPHDCTPAQRHCSQEGRPHWCALFHLNIWIKPALFVAFFFCFFFPEKKNHDLFLRNYFMDTHGGKKKKNHIYFNINFIHQIWLFQNSVQDIYLDRFF